MKNKPTFILTISCPGRIGIVAAIGNFLTDHSCFIRELHQYDDLAFVTKAVPSPIIKRGKYGSKGQ